MNKKNIKQWEEDGYLFAEWADRSLDDDDRYEDDSIILVVKTPLIEDKNKQEKNINTLMSEKYDQWVRETRI